jgi:hypothetical protein
MHLPINYLDEMTISLFVFNIFNILSQYLKCKIGVLIHALNFTLVGTPGVIADYTL